MVQYSLFVGAEGNVTSGWVQVINNVSRFHFLHTSKNYIGLKTTQVYIRLKLYEVMAVIFKASL